MKKIFWLFILIFIISVINAFAQDKKISQLTPLPSVNGSELIPVSRGGNNYYMTPGQLPAYLSPYFSAYIPLTGTTPSNPLTGTIEYRGVAGSTAFVDTIGDFYNGVGNLKNLKSATKYSYIHYGILSHSNLFQQIDFRTNDSISNSGLSLKPSGSDFFNSNSSGLSGIYINSPIPPLGSKSTIVQVDSADLIINASYSGFKGLQYNSSAYGFVATNGDQYTTFPKRYNDSIYAPISVTNFTLHANAPLSASSSTVSLIYGAGLSVSSGSLVTSAIPNSSLTNSTFTVNGTGMALGTSSTVTASAGTLTGNTLNSSVVNSSLTSVGTLTTGVWNSSLITGTYGGSGVNNGSTTFTRGGNVTYSGAYPFTGTLTSTTTVTYPTSGTLATLAGTETLTNKTVWSKTAAVVSTATLTVDASVTDFVTVTSQSVALTIAAPTNPQYAGQKITIRIKDNGTARALTFVTTSNGFRFSGDDTVPSATTLSKTVYIGAIWNGADLFWDVVSIKNNF